MELGIDIGSVDLVVQFSSPKSIATFLQRVGRSGHSIHGRPKGILFPLTRDDLVEATALLNSIAQGQLDQIVMPVAPLDILAQQIVAEVSAKAFAADGGEDGWDLQELFALMSSAYPYRNVQFDEFNTLVKMLADGYTSRRGRRGAHLHLDAINNRVRARRGANLIALTNGGAIPDMFDYQVVLDPEDVVVGSLNEDFALEALPGDVFALGTHSWQMLRIDGLKVRVRDAQGMAPTIPFWFGEGPGRTHELSMAVSNLRQTIADLLIEDSANAAIQWVVDNVTVPRSGAVQLIEYLQTGMQALGVMPTRETLVMERFFDEVGDMHVVIHAPFGSRINRAWGLALRKRFCRSFNFELQAAANEDSIVISLGSVHSFPLDDVFRYLQTATVRDVLVQALLDAPMFEVRWRWNATRSLAIQRNRNGKRVPPQFQRMDAEDLVAHVFPDQIACQENLTGKREIPDHPLVNQTIHDCLTEAMDIDALIELIGAIETNQLTLVAKDLREPSPFAQEIINARPYAFLDDAPFEERRTNVIRNRSWADPAEARDYSLLDANAIRRVQEEAWPYVSNAEELHDALLSATYITAAEFKANEYGRWQETLLSERRICHLAAVGAKDIGGKDIGGVAPGGFDLTNGIWIATEKLPTFMAIFDDILPVQPLPAFLQEQLTAAPKTMEEALKEIVQGRLEVLGPVTAAPFANELGLPEARINGALIALEVEGYAFQGQFTPALRSATAIATSASTPQVEWCERRLLQRIHRYTIDAHRKSIKPVSLETYAEFLFAHHQMLSVSEAGTPAVPALDGQTRLQTTLNLLDGIAAPAASWEANLYPARVRDYDPAWLDVMCISGRVSWGRYSLPAATSRALHKKAGGPVKSTPIIVASRHNLDIWTALAAGQQSADEAVQFSADARVIETDLQQHGASFFDQIQSRTGLLKSQLEAGLAELVSTGRLTSDSFTGLRALLTPDSKKPSTHRRRGRKAMFGVEDAGRWSLLDTFQATPAANTNARGAPGRNQWEVLNEEQLERLISIYLQRWGVLFRTLLERESFAPPWRIMLRALRKMELRGVLRGGRFVAGVGGEQFAFNDTVEDLRKFKNKNENQANKPYYSLAATDPLNLLNLILPARKLSRLMNNRVLYRGGVPVAMLDAGEVIFLREVDPDEQWALQQALQKQIFPPRLRSYLGSR